MKINRKIVLGSLVLGLGFMLTQNSQAGIWIETSKGPRLTTGFHSKDSRTLLTVHDFKQLKKGDRVKSWCPMMQETTISTIRDVDSKGHVKIKETHRGHKLSGCNIIVRRKALVNETETVMVCPDGTLTPIECRKM